MHATALLVSAGAALLISSADAHNFWVARCETTDLMNGVASNSVEFVESYEFKTADWYTTGKVCNKNDYRPWHVACIGGTYKTKWTYGELKLTWQLKSNSIEDLPDNTFFGTLTTGGISKGCCKKNFEANQWHEMAFMRNKVCNALFYCGDDNMCVTDSSLLA